mmetsp:Transcript_11366/g.22641  ORF Transcript_11366/g.22641 Transcript_11366/m.22641 type:complete len:191 (-) Transcript_11366:623-1195(-)
MMNSLRGHRSAAFRLFSTVRPGGLKDRGINDSKAGVVEATANVAEAKMQRWLKDGGAENLTGPAYKHDRHKDAATALGVGDTYRSIKILADNNIRPLSVERWMEVDKLWRELKMEIQQDWMERGRPPLGAYVLNAENKFRARIDDLDRKAKATNSAAISDGLKFGGSSPVKHVAPFKLETRIREALLEVN